MTGIYNSVNNSPLMRYGPDLGNGIFERLILIKFTTIAIAGREQVQEGTEKVQPGTRDV